MDEEQILRIITWIAELLPFASALAAFFYGLRHFFKKRKPLYLQSVTMAMACHALGSLYHIIYSLTNESVYEGFTPAFLGRIGFFLFFFVSSYGQMDRIVDDGSRALLSSRLFAVIAPVLAALLYIPNALVEGVVVPIKISYALVWIPACLSLYFNLKHSIIPNLDFGFIKALKPYNILALCLGFADLLCLTAWNFDNEICMLISAAVFSMLCLATMYAARKGVEKWTI